MEKDNRKIITVSFVLAAFLAGLVVDVLIDSLAATFGVVARFRSYDIVRHGVPVTLALVTFLSLQLNGRIRNLADEVVLETRKVVWPSRQDTMAMTSVVCVMLLLAGVVLGVFDFLSSNMIQTLIR